MSSFSVLETEILANFLSFTLSSVIIHEYAEYHLTLYANFKMNRLYIKTLITIYVSCWIFPAASQNNCESYESKIEVMTKSEFQLAEAEQIFSEYSSQECANMLLAYNFIGFAHYNESNLEKAKEFLIRGENEFFDKEVQPEQFAANQMYTSLVLIVEKDFESALYHLKKAENFAQKADEKFIQASVFQNLGLVNLEMQHLKIAEDYFNKAIGTGALDSLNIGYIYQNLAFLYLKEDNSDKTEEFINRTKSIWNETDNFKGQYLLSFIEAKHSIKNKEYKNALDYIENGRSSYKTENKLLQGENYLIEASIHENLGNHEAKITALENAILKSDDLSETQLNETISKLLETQNTSKTNAILANLVSKLKFQNINQKKINVIRGKIMDEETTEDENLIKTQVKYLIVLGGFLFLLSYLFIRISKQKSDIQQLNKSLKSSKLEIKNQLNVSMQKNKELEQFAYVASHDLKSPLRTISSFAGLMKNQNLSEKSNDYLNIIISSSKNMGDLISELLKYSTLDQSITKTKLNLQALINETLNRIKSQIEESKALIAIENNCNRIISCEKSLFVTVIQNLVANAIIYCKDNQPPRISISAEESNNHIIITISDKGIGIPESYQDTIFEMFKRLKSKNVDGTGIGLASCKKIVEKHGGKISVNSIEGEGSNFIIEIPNN